MAQYSIIIANYNTKEVLRDCLHNLMDFKDFPQIIVVDNASSDGSAKMVEQEFAKVQLIKSQNRGIPHAYNLGLEQATGEYILFLGSDVFPKEEEIQELIILMQEQTHIGIATPALVLQEGSLDMDAHRGFPTPWAAVTHFTGLNRLYPKSKLFNQYFLGYRDFSKPHEIDLCISHFMLVRAKVLEAIGDWDEEFFVFGEDVDFCYRVKQKGWKIMYFPQFKVLHLKGVSVGRTKGLSPKMRKETVRAMKLFYKKHYADKYPKIITLLILFGITVLGKLREFFGR